MPVMEEKKCLVLKETFIARVDKNVTSNELKTFLCNDDEALKRTVQLSILLSKSGQPQGYAFLTIPKSKIKRLFRKNGSKLRGKTFTLLPSENFRLPNGSQWKIEEDGVYKAIPPILASYNAVANNNKPIPFCYNMIDSGSCILQDKQLDYCIEDVLDRATKCGVEKIVLYCSNVEEARKAKRLSKLFPDHIYYTVGCDAWKDFIVDVNGLILTMKEKESFLNVAEGCNMKALKIAFVMSSVTFYHKREYDYMLRVLEYQIKWAIDLKIRAVVIDNIIWYGICSYIHVFVDDLFKIFDSFNDKLPRIAISSDGLREEQLNRLVERGYYVIITGYAWNREPPSSSIRNWLWNLPDKYLNQILLSTSVYHINFVRTFRTKLAINKKCYPEESSALTNTSLDLFQEYDDVDVSKVKSDSFPMDGHPNVIQPIVMPCLVELVAANIQHKTPTDLAKITKDNAERFYCFEELSEISRELKEPLKKLKPCVSLLTAFQELPSCDKLFWTIFSIIVLMYIHVMFINPYYPEIYILLLFTVITYICYYLFQCIFKRKH